MLETKFDQAEFSEYLGEVKNRGRTMLLPALLEAQKRYNHIPKAIAAQIGAALKVPLADVTGVIEFYSMLYPEPTADTIIRVCTSPSCSTLGGHQLHAEILGQVDPAKGKYFIEKVECLGLCDQAPAALVDETAIGHAAPGSILDSHIEYKTPVYGNERIITQSHR